MANKMNVKGYEPEVIAGVSKLKNKDENKQTHTYIPTGSFTCRVRMETIAALRRASVERKLSDQEPGTQVEIVQAALDEWLKKNGYL